jgi:uncharacterized membrane protein
MSDIDVDVMVQDYLRELDAALAPVESHRRHEILEEVTEHITQARAALTSQSSTAIRTVLENLGRPEDIAVAAGADQVTLSPQQPTTRQGSHEAVTIALLLFGGFILFVGWFVGLFMLWTSEQWRTRDKIIGSLLLPGGLVIPAWIALSSHATLFGSSCIQGIPPGGTPLKGCASSIPPDWGGIALLALMVIVPVVVAIHLHRAARNVRPSGRSSDDAGST